MDEVLETAGISENGVGGHGAGYDRSRLIDAIIAKEFDASDGATIASAYNNPMANASEDEDDDADAVFAEANIDGEVRTPTKKALDPTVQRRTELVAMSPLMLSRTAKGVGVDEDESRKPWFGFSVSQRFFIVTSTIMPLADAWTDWALITKWYLELVSGGENGGEQAWEGGGADGEDHSKARWSWFLTALSIQLLSGAMTGGLLANGEMEERVGSIAYPLSMIVGVFGMAPLVEAVVTTKDGYDSTKVAEDDQEEQDRMTQEIDGDIWMLKSIRALELVLEALPQAFLQTSIGVMYGLLEPGSRNFDTLLSFSICISLLCAGSTVVGMETMGRNKELALDVPPLSLVSRYGLATAVWRGMQTMALVFWCALFQCAAPIPGLTGIFIVVGVGMYGKSMWEAAFERSLDRLDEHTGNGTRAAFLLGSLQFLLVMAMAMMFVDATGMFDVGLDLEEEANNFKNTSANPQFPDRRSPQHRECKESHLILFLGTWAMMMSPIMMVVSLVLDPEHGGAGVHAAQVRHALAREVVEQRFLTPEDFELEDATAAREEVKQAEAATDVAAGATDEGDTPARLRYSRYVRATLNRVDPKTKEPMHHMVRVELRSNSYHYSQSTAQEMAHHVSNQAGDDKAVHAHYYAVATQNLKAGWRGFYAPRAEDEERPDGWNDMSIASGGCPCIWQFDKEGSPLGDDLISPMTGDTHSGNQIPIPVNWWNVLITSSWKQLHYDMVATMAEQRQAAYATGRVSPTLMASPVSDAGVDDY